LAEKAKPTKGCSVKWWWWRGSDSDDEKNNYIYYMKKSNKEYLHSAYVQGNIHIPVILVFNKQVSQTVQKSGILLTWPTYSLVP
jgi:hypothetical protein